MPCENMNDLKQNVSSLKLDTFDVIYKSIGQTHVAITRTERRMVVQQMCASLNKYEQEVLQIFEVRYHLYTLYNEKVLNIKSVATFSRKFNMSILGRNKQVSKRVDDLMKEAFTSEALLQTHDAIRALQKIKLRHSILYSDDVLEIVKRKRKEIESAEIALAQLTLIEQYRQVLYKSILKMTVNLAKNHKKPLVGDVISTEDLIQESIYAAQFYISQYQPIEQGLTFTDYMYRRINHHLSHYVNENTRTVALPRTIIDRYRPVAYALEKVGSSNLQTLANEATQILYELKQKSSGRKLSKEEVYTPDEVYALMGYTQDTVSMSYNSLVDNEYTYWEPSNIEDPLPNQEEQYDKANKIRLLMKVIRDYCFSSEEYTLMEMRWGSGEVKGLKSAAESYRNATGRPMNKGKVAEVEKRILERVREAVRNGDSRLLEIKNTIEVLL